MWSMPGSRSRRVGWPVAIEGHSSGKTREYVWAVIRFDPDMSSPKTQFTITEVLHDGEIAEAEVARLNALAAGKADRYFLHGTRLYPPGTSAGTQRPPGANPAP